MSTYEEMTRDELLTLKDALQKEYDEYCALDLSLNMARGKPAKDQLDLSMPMLDIISSTTDCVDEAGTDLRNYGISDYVNALADAGFRIERLVEQTDAETLAASGALPDRVRQAQMHPLSFIFKARKM